MNKIEQCCKVTDIINLLLWTSTTKAYKLNMLSQNRPCLHAIEPGLVQLPAYSIGRYRVFYGLESLESWIGVEL